MSMLQDWYLNQTTDKTLEFNSCQLDLIKQLDEFTQKYISYQRKFFFKSKIDNYGFYIHGDVGCGKTLIMNKLYEIFPDDKKLRIHLHALINNIQIELERIKHKEEPLSIVVKNLKATVNIIFIDEFVINDIATAMILKNLLESLIKNDIYIIITSNFMPDNLYKDGLMRDRFLPAIKILNDKLKLYEIKDSLDYRLLKINSNKLFIINDAESNKILDYWFNKFNNNVFITNSYINILNRNIHFIKCGKNTIWFSFLELCGNNRGKIDYLQLVKIYNCFIVEGIFELNNIANQDILIRLIWLIDILYDCRCCLVLSSNVPVNEIYNNGLLYEEFCRTKSRLYEMQSESYILRNRRI